MAAAPPLFNTPERLLHHHPPPNPCVQEFNISFESAARNPVNYNETKGKRPLPFSDSGTDSEESDNDDDAIFFRIVPAGKGFPKQKPQPSFDNDIFEMFSVVIKGIDVDNLSGYILMVGNFDEIFLFNHEKPEDDNEAITVFINKEGHKELLMTGPTLQSFLTYDPVCVHVNLTDVKTNKTLDSDFAFDTIRRNSATIYNTPLSANYSLKGFGSITFNYAVFNNAVAAKVEVILLHHDDNKNSHRIVGEIYARDSLHRIRTCLFYKKTTPCLIPYNDDGKQLLVPLSKSIVALPNLANLVIDLDLTDSDTGLSIVQNKVALFPGPPEESKMQRMTKIPLSQKIGDNILVTVTFASLYE